MAGDKKTECDIKIYESKLSASVIRRPELEKRVQLFQMEMLQEIKKQKNRMAQRVESISGGTPQGGNPESAIPSGVSRTDFFISLTWLFLICKVKLLACL